MYKLTLELYKPEISLIQSCLEDCLNQDDYVHLQKEIIGVMDKVEFLINRNYDKAQ